MRIFNLPRAGGKTMRMLYASEFQKVPILCRDQSSKASLMDKAGFWGIKIPDPITVHDLVHRPKEINLQGILVDEALTVLREVIRQVTYGTVTDVAAMTFSDETNENKVQRL